MMIPDDIRSGNSVAETTQLNTGMEPESPHTAHNWDSPDSLLLQIIETVADETGQSHDEMEPLHSVLDVDALDRLLTGNSSVRLTFSYEGCTIIASSDGTVVVLPDS